MMIELPRRRFITGLASLIAAPAIVKASSIMPVRSFFVPKVWLPCDGRAVRTRDYPELFGVIGALYGFDWVDRTFNLPDLRGRLRSVIVDSDVNSIHAVMDHFIATENYGITPVGMIRHAVLEGASSWNRHLT